jgi:hypothetical protein
MRDVKKLDDFTQDILRKIKDFSDKQGYDWFDIQDLFTRIASECLACNRLILSEHIVVVDDYWSDFYDKLFKSAITSYDRMVLRFEMFKKQMAEASNEEHGNPNA